MAPSEQRGSHEEDPIQRRADGHDPPGELVLADLMRGQRGGPRVAAEEGDEMDDPAAGGALGPELPDLVVLEVGVAEISQGRPLGAERARGRCRRALLHEYPLRVGRRGPHFSGPSAGATLRG